MRRPSLTAATVVTVAVLASGTALTLAVLISGSALTPAVAQTDPPEDDLEWGIRPLYWADTSLPGGHFTYALEAGTSIDDGIEILNFGPEPLRFDLYGADLLTAAGGGSAPASRGATPRTAGGWIVPASATVEVPPDGSVEVAFTVSIPAGTRSGNHRGALVVEPHSPQAEGAGTTTQPRLAQRVLITVPDEVDLGVEPGELVAVRERGRLRFELPVRNTGNVTFASSGAVTTEVRGRQFELELSPAGLYAVPGREAILSATWDDAPWFGRARAVAALDVVVGDDAPVRFTSGELTRLLFSWTPLLIVAGLLLLALGLGAAEVPRPRRQRAAAERRHGPAVPPAQRARRRAFGPPPPPGPRGTRAERHRRRRRPGARR